MKLSIVVPVYNEKNTLAEVISRILRETAEFEREIIIVDDGSTDGTRDVLEPIRAEHEGQNIVTLLHDKNRGKGAALRTGFERVSGDIIIIQDADLEYDPCDYPRLIAPILAGRADVVYGSRFSGGQAHRVLLFWHMMGNRFLTLLSNALTNLNLTDMATCYKVFRAEVLEKIHLVSDRFEFEPEFTAKVARAGFRVYEVGVSYSGRDYAEGKKITWVDGFKAILAILRYRFWR